MTRVRPPVAALAALLLTLHALAPAARAGGPASGPVEPNSRSGVYASVACGIGVRTLLTGGLASGLLVIATLGVCAYMMWDALGTPD
jgi:hypothetical protein